MQCPFDTLLAAAYLERSLSNFPGSRCEHQPVPNVDVEIVSGTRRVLIHDAHNLSHVAITVIDHRPSAEPLLLAPSRPDRLLSAVIGRTEGRDPTALLVISTRDARLRDHLIEIGMDRVGPVTADQVYDAD